MWKWLMRKMPKRVITYDNKEFFPQVWFLWWHYCWNGISEFAMPDSYSNMSDAIDCLKIRWAPTEKKIKKVVWKNGKNL